ncbi:hypothetical protein [Bifidobacterium castoris]|uniref:Uncharacterized protein n=1 Tax=Bifidobacterium castoris TaxID=2306972 RepID=A0A430FAD8_9BIFI|nr:hypothetical protein [Bifidobacterium castoris]RSX49807.1 hypothetical protein D2E22_0268 [Bifidobacterium castoris]
MTFDLTDWWPVQMVGGSSWGDLVFIIIPFCAAIITPFFLVKHIRNSDTAWVRNHHVVVSVLLFVGCGILALQIGRVILNQPAATRQTTTLGVYITEKAEAYTPTLTDVECETPVVDHKYEFLKQDGRYLCTWRFDGKPVKGSVRIAGPKANGWSSTPPTATLVDSHGDVWCPVEWETSNGCEPVSKPPEAS